MGNLSSVTLGDATFPVFASGGGGSDMPIHIQLPKSASDSTPSGLAMLAWPNGMRYVYFTVNPGNSNVTGFIPPEYMGNGSVYIIDKTPNTNGSGHHGNTVSGNSTSGANVVFEFYLGFPPEKTSILFFVNPN